MQVNLPLPLGFLRYLYFHSKPSLLPASKKDTLRRAIRVGHAGMIGTSICPHRRLRTLLVNPKAVFLGYTDASPPTIEPSRRFVRRGVINGCRDVCTPSIEPPSERPVPKDPLCRAIVRDAFVVVPGRQDAHPPDAGYAKLAYQAAPASVPSPAGIGEPLSPASRLVF